MKHVLLNKDGQIHATILCCPFKYTLPRSCTVYEDNPTMGKLNVDAYTHLNPKPQEDINADAIDFAVIKDGVVQSVIVWGGAEWCPPLGTMMVPLDKWMGKGDHYITENNKFIIHEDRCGRADKDKSVKELQEDAHAVELQKIQDAQLS